MSVTLFACTACGHVCFPARQLCHRCGGAAWRPVSVDHGIADDATTVLYQTGAADAGPCHLASVRMMDAVVLLVRMDQPAARGQTVKLHMDGTGAILGTGW